MLGSVVEEISFVDGIDVIKDVPSVAEVTVEICVAVKNTEALLGSSSNMAALRSSPGHTPSLLHGFEVQHPKKVGPLMHVYHNPWSTAGIQLSGGILLYLSASKLAGNCSS